jgi:arabinan endo-1,5-alpha-L-arabinosidase
MAGLAMGASGCQGELGEGPLPGESAALNGTASYQNPIIPMFGRPPGAPVHVANVPGEPATEGCPDPSALRTPAGEFYIYCTSYSFAYSRHNGFPIFKASSLAGPWTRVGSLIPDGGETRSTWPAWVKDSRGIWDGSFWGPDVHRLPNGKYYAGYAAPCGVSRCVGIAWADHPEGPWHHAREPFITHENNGAGSSATYDPNLLVTSQGELFLYWVVVGKGVFGARVTAEASGELRPVRADQVHLIADRATHRGEGPYVVEHKGAYYEFYSTGSLLFGYHVGVRRSPRPLGRFTQEGPQLVVQPNDRFVATGGNSVVGDGHGHQFLVYHAIVVPTDGGCPRREPIQGHEIDASSNNPHCREQAERQAMIDAIDWQADPEGIEWPVLRNGQRAPSVGRTALP